jgi:hypothetical protein
MDYDYSWRDNDGAGYWMAKAHGLKSPQPIMWSTPESGNCICMFQSGSKYYLWNPIEGGVWEIITSMDLLDIVTAIGKLGLGSLKLAKVYEMSTYS